MDSATLTIDVLALALSAASVTAVLTVTYFFGRAIFDILTIAENNLPIVGSFGCTVDQLFGLDSEEGVCCCSS